MTPTTTPRVSAPISGPCPACDSELSAPGATNRVFDLDADVPTMTLSCSNCGHPLRIRKAGEPW